MDLREVEIAAADRERMELEEEYDAVVKTTAEIPEADEESWERWGHEMNRVKRAIYEAEQRGKEAMKAKREQNEREERREIERRRKADDEAERQVREAEAKEEAECIARAEEELNRRAEDDEGTQDTRPKCDYSMHEALWNELFGNCQREKKKARKKEAEKPMPTPRPTSMPTPMPKMEKDEDEKEQRPWWRDNQKRGYGGEKG